MLFGPTSLRDALLGLLPDSVVVLGLVLGEQEVGIGLGGRLLIRIVHQILNAH